MARFAPHPERRPAVVTGASSGIGRAVASALARAGHPVVVGARRLERLEQLAAQIARQGGWCRPLRLDLADPESVQAFAQAAEAEAGDLDVVVSAAGRDLPEPALGPDPEQFAQTLAVNLLGVQHLVSLLLPAMVGRGRGDLVFVTSEVVRAPRVRNSAYVASKWGLAGYARTLQMELEGTGVRASIVQPGQTLTEMGSDWDPAAAAEVLEQWVRWGLARHDHFLRPEHVAEAVLAAVQAPPGTQFSLLELEPLAPPGPAVPPAGVPPPSGPGAPRGSGGGR
jgi:NAD(P)-dependent dehydrogenase (short-subunit alcohol dehydrogenase family)